MFNKIFSRKKIKSKLKPKIIADTHEKNSLIISELHSNKDVELEIKSLKIGDYLIGDIIIERKTINDFISSMINKRLIQQLKQLQKYKQNLLIIEGQSSSFFEKNKFNLNSIRGFILSISLNYHIPVIMTRDYIDTSKYLIILSKQKLKKHQRITLHSRIPKTIEEQKQYILEAFPNIGPKTSEKLLKKFKTIKNILNADEKELKEILKRKTTDFKKIIND